MRKRIKNVNTCAHIRTRMQTDTHENNHTHTFTRARHAVLKRSARARCVLCLHLYCARLLSCKRGEEPFYLTRRTVALSICVPAHTRRGIRLFGMLFRLLWWFFGCRDSLFCNSRLVLPSALRPFFLCYQFRVGLIIFKLFLALFRSSFLRRLARDFLLLLLCLPDHLSAIRCYRIR